ncbi:MAG TPA: autotransporter assembly complex family protein [Paracoccaceae bacterium]|nr:autotransporter assembly complex family protein [Paracoccaceae bacterium]
MARLNRPVFGIAALVLSALPALSQDVRFRISDNGALRPALEAASLLVAQEAGGEASAQDIVAAARADYPRLLAALYADGYFGATVSILIDGREAANIAPLDAPSQIRVVDIIVAPGPVFRFGMIEARPLPEGATVPSSFASGAPASTGAIRDAARAGIDAWRDAGHAKAALESQRVIADHRDDRLDVSLRFAPGARLTFGPVAVEGNSTVSSNRIREIAGLPEGAVFSPAEIDRALARLRRAGAFRAASLTEANAATADLALPTTLKVVEEKPRRLGFGAELTSFDGLALSAYWMHRNLLGGSESLRLDGSVEGIGGATGALDARIGAAFVRPATFGADTDLLAEAEILHREDPLYGLDSASLDLGLRRRLSETLELGLALGVKAANVTDDFGYHRYTVLTLPATATLDRRDSPLDARKGFFLDAEVTPFLSLMGDAGTGARIWSEGRAYFTPGQSDRLTFAARAQLGSVIGPDLLSAPPDYLFFSGGGGTVRGQPYQSLAIDLGDDRIGGLSLATLSAELRARVTDTIGIVGFADAGYVGASAVPLTNGDWHAGAGIGIRYETGLGPIRLDVATPVTGSGAGQSINIYVGIGQAF